MNRRTPPWAIVAKREILVQLTDKAFWIGTITTLAIIAIAFGFSFLAGGGSNEATKVGVDSDAGAGVVAMANAQGQNLDPVTLSPDALEGAVESGEVEAGLRQTDGGWEMLSTPSTGFSGPLDLTNAVRDYQLEVNAAEMGVDASALLADATVTMTTIGAESDALPAIFITTLAFAVLFMYAAITYGMQIAQSVVTEKESRIVEILAASIPIRHLLIGKVVGNTIMALGQVIIFVTVALVGLSFTDFRSLVGVIAPVAGWFIVFFLVGFAALACLWAAAGAMATRVQDLSQTTTPLMMVVMGVYMAGFLASGSLAAVLSYVPIASTVMMPGRLLSGEAGWLDAGLALLAAIAFMALAIWFGSQVYRRGLLQTGSVMTFRQALRGNQA